eukprot:363950-Chlamydomonas_euryale.AAC.5
MPARNCAFPLSVAALLAEARSRPPAVQGRERSQGVGIHTCGFPFSPLPPFALLPFLHPPPRLHTTRAPTFGMRVGPCPCQTQTRGR